MLSVITSCAFMGIEAYPVTVEVDIASGLPGFTMVGLPDSAVKEARERVFAALKNSGFAVPSKRITVNLAPGGIRKEGTAFDLALALGILAASEQIDSAWEGLLFLGELSLDGGLRPVRGALSAALYAKAAGLTGLVVPQGNRSEAAQVSGLGSFGAPDLLAVLEFLDHPTFPASAPAGAALRDDGLDFREVKGQAVAKRALEVAAAGGHNFLLIGGPGCGKTLLARRLPSILPLLSEAEALETARVHSVAGLLKPGLDALRHAPFRAPHHLASEQALVGTSARPGEMSLAHNGVLFLDELPEFRANVIEALRQPLEEGSVTVSRASHSVTYPCRVMLAAAMNPCPCGFLLDRGRRCLCRVEEIARYLGRISGPLLDRIDIHLEVSRLSYAELTGGGPGESSQAMRGRVEAARAAQRRRFDASAAAANCNARMSGESLRQFCGLRSRAQTLLREAVESLALSARAYDRILRVARTMADLAESPGIGEDHVSEAIHYRCLDRQFLPFS